MTACTRKNVNGFLCYISCSEVPKTPFAFEIKEGARYLKCRHGHRTLTEGIIMIQFTDCNIKVFNEWGITDRKKWWGEKKSPSKTVWKMKGFMVNTKRRENDQDKKWNKVGMPDWCILCILTRLTPGVHSCWRQEDTEEDHSMNI